MSHTVGAIAPNPAGAMPALGVYTFSVLSHQIPMSPHQTSPYGAATRQTEDSDILNSIGAIKRHPFGDLHRILDDISDGPCGELCIPSGGPAGSLENNPPDP